MLQIHSPVNIKTLRNASKHLNAPSRLYSWKVQLGANVLERTFEWLLTLKFYWMHWTHNKQLRSRYEVSSLPRLQTEILSVLQAITTTIIEVNNQLQRKDNDIWSCLYTVSQCGRKIKFDQGFMKLNATFWTAVYMESLWGSCSATTVLQRKSNFTVIHLKVQWRVSYVWQRLLQFVKCCGLRDTDIECSPLNKSSAHCWPNLLQNSTSLSLSVYKVYRIWQSELNALSKIYTQQTPHSTFKAKAWKSVCWTTFLKETPARVQAYAPNNKEC
jgi:hypothetical protein